MTKYIHNSSWNYILTDYEKRQITKIEKDIENKKERKRINSFNIRFVQNNQIKHQMDYVWTQINECRFWINCPDEYMCKKQINYLFKQVYCLYCYCEVDKFDCINKPYIQFLLNETVKIKAIIDNEIPAIRKVDWGYWKLSECIQLFKELDDKTEWTE